MESIYQKQRVFFSSGQTKSLDFRKNQLITLKKAIETHQKNIQDALYKDLKKSAFEAYAAEIGITLTDIDHAIAHLKHWMKPQKAKTFLFFQPASSYIMREPYGISLVIAPWNYPFKNLIGPVIGAMAAGNTLILKPSEVSAHTSLAITKMIEEFFPAEYMAVVEGGAEITQSLIDLKPDYVFFTGGPSIGKLIYQSAAKHLIPCTLELGGKSPCVIDQDVDLDVTAKRLIWGKFYNTGQTCVAPDFVLVHTAIKDQLIEKLKHYIQVFFGADPQKSVDYGRIISDKHTLRIQKLIQGKVVIGGQVNLEDKYIAPTVIDQVNPSDPVMQEEIFGPVLPILTFSNLSEVVQFINERDKPLALYLFSRNKQWVNHIIENTSSGGVCVNETIMHMVPPTLPFGGVGNSGLGGAYNGWFGYDTFSHKKAVMKKHFWLDLDKKYPPYTQDKQNFIRFALKRLM